MELLYISDAVNLMQRYVSDAVEVKLNESDYICKRNVLYDDNTNNITTIN